MVTANSTSEHFSVLPDPCNDRSLNDEQCPRIINKSMEDSALFGADGVSQWRVLKDFLAREGPITKPQIMRLLQSALSLFGGEPNLVQIEEPICVVGDIHGQYADLLNICLLYTSPSPRDRG